jgi:hypothetical protein
MTWIGVRPNYGIRGKAGPIDKGDDLFRRWGLALHGQTFTGLRGYVGDQ